MNHVRSLFLLVFTLPLLAAQPVITITGPATVTAGQTASLTLSLSGSAGQSLAGIQWTQTLPTGVSLGTPTISTAFGALGAGVYCGPTACLSTGLSSTNVVTLLTMTDGAVATVPVIVANTVAPGNLTLPLTGTLGASITAASVVVNAGASYTIKVLSRCDVNGDGVVNGADVNAVIQSLINVITPCPLPTGVSCNLPNLIKVMQAALGQACTI